MAITLKSTNSTSSTSDAASFTFTNGLVVAAGTDRFLTCAVSSEDGTDADMYITSIVVDPAGVNKSLTKSVEASTGGGGFSNYASLWYLKEADFPAAATYDVVVTFPGSVSEYGITLNVYESVDSTSPEATGSQVSGSTTTVSAAITTISANAWVVDCASSGEAAVSISPDSPQVSRNVTDADSHWHGCSDVPIVTAGATSTDWTAVSSENRFILVNLALKPTGGGGGGGGRIMSSLTNHGGLAGKGGIAGQGGGLAG